MKKNLTNKPVHPVQLSEGITLREYIATEILAAMTARLDVRNYGGIHGAAEQALEQADALIAAMEAEDNGQR
jgi:hypothetical protein